MAGKLATIRARTAVAVFFFVMAGISATLAAGRVPEGRAIAERWCSACHVVSGSQDSASADAPSFGHIAAGLEEDADKASLELFLADPHPVMPNMNLSRQEVADIVAYIASLRGAD